MSHFQNLSGFQSHIKLNNENSPVSKSESPDIQKGYYNGENSKNTSPKKSKRRGRKP